MAFQIFKDVAFHFLSSQGITYVGWVLFFRLLKELGNSCVWVEMYVQDGLQTRYLVTAEPAS